MPSADRDFLSLAGAVGLGAAAMYFLDPARGTRRRHVLADKMVHTRRLVGEGIRTTRLDLRNRAFGVTARVRRRFARDEMGDEVVAERVRAELGRAVSHPSGIDVSVTEGRASLVGVVLSDEAERLLRHVRSVRGVHEIDDRLERHETPDDVPGLRGSRRRLGSRFPLLEEHWNPTVRLLTGVTGTALLFGGLTRGGRAGWPVGLTGLALLARAVVNEPLLSVTGLRGGPYAVRVRTAIDIDAPADVVFDYIIDWERWPEWMPNVLRVTRSGWEPHEPADMDAASQEDLHLEVGERWEVEGSAGARVTWGAVITRFVENQSVSWRSPEGAALQHTGTLHLEPREGDATRLQIDLSYNPVIGRVGNLVAALFGRVPTRQTQVAFESLKSVIETGAAQQHGAARESRGRTALRRWKAQLR